MNKTKLSSILAVSTALLLSSASASTVHAFWPFDGLNQQANGQAVSTPASSPTFMDRLIEKFGLNKDEVSKVADEFRTERRTQMEAQFETRLNEAVTLGKVTEEQKTLIMQKHEELQAQNQQTFQNRQSHRDEIEAWATENGIDSSYLGFGNRGQGRGMGMGRGMNK